MINPRSLISACLFIAPLLAAPIPRCRRQAPDAGGKLVFAHFMVGNTFPYTQQDWSDDIALAQSSGIDGFALNVGAEDFQRDRVKDAYAAAQAANSGFKLFISLDVQVQPCTTADQATSFRAFINEHATHPNQFQKDGKAFVSTFGGQDCTFGAGSPADGWKTQFAQHPDLAGKIFFIPSFFVDPSTQFSQFADVMDGDFHFDSAWPISLQPGASPDEITAAIGSIAPDQQHLTALKALPAASSGAQRSYMAAVSPWFFTHYGPDTFNKNFLYDADQHLYATRWENLIKARDQVDYVEAITWNDFGESHYLGPVKGDQAKSEAWTTGFDHTGWLALTKYYATAFKTGSFPAVDKNQLIIWSRPHPAQATASDPVGQPTGFQLVTDNVWAVALTTADSTVTLSTSASNTQQFNVPAGANKISIKINAGDTMSGFIEQGGNKVAEVTPPDGFTFNGTPPNYNFNALVVSSK